MKRKNTSIIILTYNNLEYTINCINSIRKYTKDNTYEVIVVDNMSNDGTREWLKVQNDLKIVLNNHNMGFPKGCNQGIKKANPNNDILLLNNDTIVTTNWLNNLKKCLYSNDKIGAVGAVCNHNENLQGVDFSYDDFDAMQELAKTNNISNKNMWEEKNFLIGFCILIKREVLQKCGYLDEKYSPGYIEDNDLSLRIIENGFKLVLCHDCFIHHYLGTAFRENLNKFYPILLKNRNYFKKKWGFKTDEFDKIKYASLKLLDEDKSNNLKILEIECGIGSTLLKIKKSHFNSELHGIDSNKKRCLITNNITKVDYSPLGTFPSHIKKDYYDYIIIGDILEKIKNPNIFLKNAKKYLKSGGFLIGEFQNISHYEVIKNLLKNNWFYNTNTYFKNNKYNYYTLTDIYQLCYSNNYRNLFVLHWYSNPNEEDTKFIENIGKIVEEKRLYLYKTYYFSFKFQK